ncbi:MULTISPECIES: four helix bundle protein [Niastella]|uniref:Four helix bundle protein n=1 Tax=Niastella soli TaxID=2821487 RepID=A0ABS3YRZ4_9BACT|nr:four helix bundle protein [Niastella soli]MBO9200352.1 four helix bundle protein [Niastella soli]
MALQLNAMFLQLAHKERDIYKVSKLFVVTCYRLTNTFPSEEKFNMISQIRRAALSVPLNIAEGASRKSDAERKRFYEIARGSVIEIDAPIEVAAELKYVIKEEQEELGELMIRCFQMLTKMIGH